MNVIKRNGTEMSFNTEKIVAAISKANNALPRQELTDSQIREAADYITFKCERLNRAVSVEEIQDMVERQLIAMGASETARAYIKYRYKRYLARKANTTDDRILSLIDTTNEEVKEENSNKNPVIASTQRDYMAGEVSKDLADRILLPEDVVKADKEGIIKFHDKDYFAQHITNCQLVNLKDMLQNGTVISDTLIESPHSFSTACTITTQIVAQVASSQFGGQSISLAHLAPFVDVSRKRIRAKVIKELEGMGVSQERIEAIVESRVRDEVTKGIQTIQYQIITLMTTNGQAPFVTVFMYLNEAENEQERADLALIIEETLKQRYIGVKNDKGVYITPAFPKLIYVTEEDNIREDSPYWYLTELAIKCTAKRMVPDYISEQMMKKLKEGNCYPAMGCRSFLAPWKDENGNYKFYGRFNQGVVTLNLVDVACSAIEPGGDINTFWQILDERLELCHKALRCRHERLLGTKSDIAPILWQHGALARLKPGETIDKLLYGGYSSISLGYAGLWECVYELTHKKLTEPEGEKLGLEIMQRLNDACDKWKAAENIGYSLYGTPLETTTYTFAKALQKRFGIIKGVTDKAYITNSYHIHVTEDINAFDKLAQEAKFQEKSLGGCISYVEVPNLQNNLAAVKSIVQFMYDHIMYAELNTKSDFCEECGYDGEIECVEDENGKLIWKCPNCGCTDQDRLYIVRRTCGYLGVNKWNQGRTQEIKERVLHL